ncbi:MAG: hypothetical protein HZR80_18110 [Candidatus Heimdallarchaeota archaeon]
MKGIKHGNKIRKFCKTVISFAYSDSVSSFFQEIKNFQKLAEKITEQAKYEKYFSRHMTHELNLIRIELKKIELNYKDSIHRTSRKIEEFEAKLADKELNQDMKDFYRKEYLNILKPMFFIEQVNENFKKYYEVLMKIKDEFNEWFFLGRVDFLKQILKPYIVSDDSSSKDREIWIYKKYAKELTKERKERMYQKVGLKAE